MVDGQIVRAENGFAYGSIGADIHVFGDGIPLYLLEDWRPEPPVDQRWLRELPSRMLNTRFAVVAFTGRKADVTGLRNRMSRAGRLHDALAPLEEAVGILGRLAGLDPGAYNTELTTCLSNLGDLLNLLDRPDNALAVFAKSTAVQRQMAAADPATHMADLAKSLTTLGDQLARLGRPDEAVDTYQEAVTAYRTLPGMDFAIESDFTVTLNNLGQSLSDLERLAEAIAATTEAVALRRKATRTDPAHGVELARSLSNLGLLLSYTGHGDKALAVTRESVECYRRAAACPAGSDEAILARVLLIFAWVRLSGQSPAAELKAAVPAAAEAVDVYRRLSAARPAEFGADLRTATKVLADVTRAKSS